MFSGGLDSLCSWFLLGNPDTLYVTTGAPWEFSEIETVQSLGEDILGLEPVIATGPSMVAGIDSDGHIPFRNLRLVLEAAGRGYTRILLGALKGETSRDKTEKFARDTSALLTYLEQKLVSVELPFRGITKTDLVKLYLDRGFDPYYLTLTRSCYSGVIREGTVGCGECLACLRRWVAMSNNGLHESYDVHPMEYMEGIPAVQEAIKYSHRLSSISDLAGAIRNHLDLRRAMKRVDH